MSTSKRAKIAALALCISLQSFYTVPAWANSGDKGPSDKDKGNLAYEELVGNNDCKDPIPNSRIDKLENQVNKETTDRQKADTTLDNKITQETTDRQKADTALDGKITKETTDRQKADTDLDNKITKETTDRQKADTTLDNKITQETTDRQKADTALDGKITKETSDRQKADTALDNKITKETTDRQKADTALDGKITKETSDRQTADTALDNKITKETTDRQTADTALDGKITKETSDRQTADTTLDNKITQEATNRVADVSRLDSRIDGLSDRVDKVGALSAAMTALAPLDYDPQAPTQISVGAGTYGGSQAVAIGVYHYANKDTLYNAAWSISGSEQMGRVGATWRVGRPHHPREVAVTTDKHTSEIQLTASPAPESKEAVAPATATQETQEKTVSTAEENTK